MEPPPPRPKLNLKLSLSNLQNASNNSQPQTPNSQQRTPSIKLNFGKSSVPPTPSDDGQTPTAAAKKRKRTEASSVDLDAASTGKIAPPRLLKLITKQGPTTLKNSAVTPGIKLKTKGKIPKRPSGVGYDSELEDREVDPVVLEAIVLRMQPGPDCEYIRNAITNGTIGVSVLQNGADIRLRFFDTNGRRGILIVQGSQYAVTLVDLPTITEAMKSWDRKNFIKSVDISQMLLVLGRCYSDDEARNYPLPPDVNSKYQYAHGLTAPMKNVRKRRFERTIRARVDDIESIERKVHSLVEADDRAEYVKYDVLDYDPRNTVREYSSEYDSDEDAEGEDDEEDGYFPSQNGATDSAMTGDQPQYNQAEAEALAALFNEDDADFSTATVPATTGTSTVASSHDATTSAAASPAAQASEADNDDDDEEGPDADADADADDDDDSDRDNNDEKAEILAKIKDIQEKIAEQEAKFKKTDNRILKSKISKKVAELQSDLRMQRRHAGLNTGEGGGDDDGSEEE